MVATASAALITQTIEQHRPDLAPLQELYKHLHRNPELSNQERETAATIAARLRALSPDFVIKTGIGGHGVAAVLRRGKNGGNEGPTVLLRADIDALPVEERTGLPYASTRRMRDAQTGVDKAVMHACGHDMHITTLLGSAALLVSAAAAGVWSGTLVLVFQPAEERGTGARDMVADGLYDPRRHKVPVPDVVLGAHVVPARTGTVGSRRGLIATSADSMRITLHGRGAHASMPHVGIDPVVMGASAVLRLQTVVAREVDPYADSAVVTVASFHAGDAENVIPDSARLSVDVRAVSQGTRERVLRRVREVVRCECAASNAPREPEFETTREFPTTINDDAVTAQLEKCFAAHFGGDNNHNNNDGYKITYNAEVPRVGMSEDFGVLGSAVGRPYCFWLYGGTDGAVWDHAEREGRVGEDVPINHSAYFAPAIMPTLRVGLDAYAVAALTFLGRGEGVEWGV
ncbi:Uu.00g020450.m01.CDS01 [Anthostomella pinea]|uniref:Uu.00g020450.m01.CDS01 n=1 Tax=Anthostomella pinea TaxID=933095 RepID=A0AAI8YQW5_9PEZI|nr:Uu.00g020450.m01.CDS01 [Anthostomella pinea]